jgi:hypothetical protein
LSCDGIQFSFGLLQVETNILEEQRLVCFKDAGTAAEYQIVHVLHPTRATTAHTPISRQAICG